MNSNEGCIKTVLAVQYDITTNQYLIGTCQGSSVAEMAFATMVVARTLTRDGHIKSEQDFLDLVKKYIDDPQFREVESNG